MNAIATQFNISQSAISKHLQALERAGLIEGDIDKQRRPSRLRAEPMVQAVDWLEEFKGFWSSGLDHLDGLLNELKSVNIRTDEKECIANRLQGA